jgi:hypothetical protein
MKLNAIISSLLFVLVTTTSTSFSYELSSPVLRWPDATTKMSIHLPSFPDGRDQAGLMLAMNRWNDNPSNFQFTMTTGSSCSYGGDYPRNEICMAVGDSGTPPAVARTRFFPTTGEIVEADIIFYDDVNWSSDNYP